MNQEISSELKALIYWTVMNQNNFLILNNFELGEAKNAVNGQKYLATWIQFEHKET
jgi:hypothetical protein